MTYHKPPTKKAKRVKLNRRKRIMSAIEGSYTCPNCKTTIKELNWLFPVEITRFKCSRCKQELIIDKE